MMYERSHPGWPWLTQASNAILETCLRKTDQMLEFGSGRSTAWFASKVGHITSVEHHRPWFEKVSVMLREQGHTNVTYKLAEVADRDVSRPNEPYIEHAKAFGDVSLDVVLVDGLFRGQCARSTLKKIKSGGLLIVDNANWFLPSNTKSPNSRSISDGPLDDDWRHVETQIATWRRIWTTNHMSDTAIFIKPAVDA